MTPLARAEDFSEVFAAFGLTPAGPSIYECAPVFRVVFQGQDAVLKRTQGPEHAPKIAAWTDLLQRNSVPVVSPLAGARLVGKRMWVIYPFVSGRPYNGSLADIAAAGRLLGAIHAPGSHLLTPFAWPDNTPQSVQEDVDGLQALAEFLPPQTIERLTHWELAFDDEVYAPLRAAELPRTDASLDFKANNLVFGPGGLPTLIDPDNGEDVPRIFDLALAALTFHLDLAAPGRVFTPAEWRTFYAAYAQAVTLNPTECQLWPLALRYMLQEWGVWHLTNAPQDWQQPAQRAFLTSLAQVDLNLFTLDPEDTR